MAKIIAKDNLVNLLEFKNQTDSEVDIYFYGDIVSSWWESWQESDKYPDEIKKCIEKAGGRRINMHMNSNGGSVFAGIAIYNMLKSYEGEVVCYVDGVAASIASVITLAADRVIMRSGSALMIHSPMICIHGAFNSQELEKMSQDLKEIQACIMQVYEENKLENVTKEYIEELVNQETWLTSEKAAEIFNIEIDTETKAVACTSDFMDKFCKIPPQYAQESEGLEEINKLKAQLNYLKLGGRK